MAKCLICGKEIKGKPYLKGINPNGEEIYICSEDCHDKSEYYYSHSTHDYRHGSTLKIDEYDGITFLPTKESVLTDDGANFMNVDNANLSGYVYSIEKETWTRRKI